MNIILESGLILIIALVLILPITVHFIERNLEAFLFVMGICAATLSHVWGTQPVWSSALVLKALEEPMLISLAVLIIGIVIYFLKSKLDVFMGGIEKTVGLRIFSFLLITVLGLLSSVITAIMAAIILSEAVNLLKYDKKYEIKIVVLGCYAIGLGAALTPIGEPLSTICVSKLRGEPYYADFFFLFRLLGVYIIPGVLVMGIMGYFMKPPKREVTGNRTLYEHEKEHLSTVIVRAIKVYVFIAALVLLGEGFKPIVDNYIVKLSSSALYWINMISAVMDNATLAAAEISPVMSIFQIKYILMGLLVSGGMLIPGNIPNIISAGKLRISSKEWAKAAVPLGLVMMVVYFIVFLLH